MVARIAVCPPYSKLVVFVTRFANSILALLSLIPDRCADCPEKVILILLLLRPPKRNRLFWYK